MTRNDADKIALEIVMKNITCFEKEKALNDVTFAIGEAIFKAFEEGQRRDSSVGRAAV